MINKLELEEDLDRNGFKDIILKNKDIIILKFTADWCGPCGKAKPIVETKLNELEEFIKEKKNVVINFYEIVVDDYFDIYALLKSKKMLSGIPHMMCFVGENNFERQNYYVPDFSVSGADTNNITTFFDNIKSVIY